METDQEKAERYEYLFRNGWLTLNEVRLLSGLPVLDTDMRIIEFGNLDSPSYED